MKIRQFSLSSSSSAYLYCILALLFGDGFADVYITDERRGQPEMQQTMDNAPEMPAIRSLEFPSGQNHGYPIMLTQKTSTLLSEALHVLQRIKDVKERKWVETFIHRLGGLAADLEDSKNSRKMSKEMQDTVENRPVEKPALNSSPLGPSKFNKQQSKYQVTSAQINDVLPINEGHVNRQVVTKPSHLSAKADDELVQQLHRQNSVKSRFPPQEPHVTYHTRPLESTATQAVTSSTTPLNIVNHRFPKFGQTKDKSKQTMLSKLLNEIDVLKRERDEEKNSKSSWKQMDNQHIADFTNPEFALDQNHNFADEDNEFEIEEDEGAAAGELDEYEEPLKNTVPPSWQKVMDEQKKVQQISPIPESQLEYQPVRLAPPEPTMSDEMKRQLRSGKIVVISDSLVKTNFGEESNADHVDKESALTKPISYSRSPGASEARHSVSK